MSKDWQCPECKNVVTAKEIEKVYNGIFDGACPICGYTPKAVPTKAPKGDFSVSKKQLGILVLDGSGSMVTVTQELITKAEAVSNSVSEFFETMKSSSISNHFCFAVIDFDEESYLRLGITETEDINAYDDYNPVREAGKRTYLYTGLEETEKIADEFLNAGDKDTRSVVVVVMTDGLDMNEEKAKTTANRMKEKYGNKLKITASCFGTRDLKESDKNHIMNFLNTIVTDKSLCLETSSAKELRSFFIASVSR